MSVSPRKQVADIRRHGFVRGESECWTCDECGKKCGRGWWLTIQYSCEYDTHLCFCRNCAYVRANKWDDFEIDKDGTLVKREVQS